MKNPSQEDLLGYVLGALDAQEHRDVQQLIDENPEIEEQLLQIKNALLPLDCLETSGPRPGLARRTCEAVAVWQNDQVVDFCNDQPVSSRLSSLDESIQSAIDAAEPKNTQPKMRSVSDRIFYPRTWSIPDVLVGMALIAIMAGILFPTISYTRYNNRVASCQNNLREVGIALMDFSSANEGQFVSIPRDGNLAAIGCVGPILKDAGFLQDDSLLACAGVAANLPPVHIPSCNQIKNACSDDEVNFLRHTMFGHYGYTMGHRVNDRYYPPRNMGRTNVVLVADQPSSSLPGRVSSNHSNRGQNLLFEDGHVEFLVGPSWGDDAIFVNDYGIVGPGSNPSDNVIAPSHLSLAQADHLIQMIELDTH